MSTEIRLPIKIDGWVVMRDLSIDHVEVDRNGWEYGPLPYGSEYGEDKDVIVFRDLSEHDPAKRDRVEADINIVAPVQQLVNDHDVSAHRWVAGPVELDEPVRLLCVPTGDGTLGPSEDVSRAVKDHLNDLRDGYPLEFDEFMAERFPLGFEATK